MLNHSTNKLRAVVILGLMGISFTMGNINGWTARPALANQLPPEFELFSEAWNIVLERFVDRDQIDTQRMIYGAIEGMLNTLGDQNHTTFYYAQGEGYGRQMPLVVLINGGTASASEILSGALQKNRRATLIDTTSLGTGIIYPAYTLL